MPIASILRIILLLCGASSVVMSSMEISYGESLKHCGICCQMLEGFESVVAVCWQSTISDRAHYSCFTYIEDAEELVSAFLARPEYKKIGDQMHRQIVKDVTIECRKVNKGTIWDYATDEAYGSKKLKVLFNRAHQKLLRKLKICVVCQQNSKAISWQSNYDAYVHAECVEVIRPAAECVNTLFNQELKAYQSVICKYVMQELNEGCTAVGKTILEYVKESDETGRKNLFWNSAHRGIMKYLEKHGKIVKNAPTEEFVE